MDLRHVALRRRSLGCTTRPVFVDESLWIRRALERLPLQHGSSVLDMGSSNQHFRMVVQPHIESNVFAPLRARGAAVLHLDARDEPGVDIVADVTTLQGVDRTFDLVLCANLLEHVVNRDETLANVRRVVAPGGALLVTVPRRYPIHHDPIDTGFRPSTAELVELVGWPRVLQEELVTIHDPRHYARRRWIRQWLWPWQVACVLVRKPD